MLWIRKTEVVAVLDEIAGQRIEECRAPRLAIHLVGVSDDAVAEGRLPEAIDHRAGEPSVARVGEDRRRGGAPIGQRRRRRLAAQLRVEKPGLGVSILRDVTAIERSRASGEKNPASEHASLSFHLLTKLSWQALHFRFTPRKTCAVFCDACIQGVTAALVSPRQFTPTRNPSGSVASVGLISLLTN